MIQEARQSNAAPGSLDERLHQLGLTQLRLKTDGSTAPIGPIRWIEQVLINTPIFRRAIQQHWPQLNEQVGQTHEVWPGLFLATLPRPKRRRVPRGQAEQSLDAILLLGPELITCEQLRQVCQVNQLDVTATISRIDNEQLLGAGEAHRLISLLNWMYEDTHQVVQRVDDLETLSRELTSSYEELSLLYKLSASMTVDQPSVRFLTDACGELREVVNLKWMALQLIDNEPRLENLAGQVFTAGPVDGASSVFRRVGQQLIELCQERPNVEPIIIDDTATLDVADAALFCSNLLVIPLRANGNILGVLFGGDKQDSFQITTVDSKLCCSLASSLTIFLENKMLYEDVQAMFMGTLHALTSAIDAKDSYTRGHSERVALMSRRLAEAAGLDDDTVDRIYISGLIHDVGKIGVPESVLCKNGRLTDSEFDQIKKHPDIGARILQDIRQMKDLIPGVLHHHERWDGRGYPRGLVGDDCPLFGRVICLADSFDAMSSDRTYRRALDHGEVLAEIRRCSGTQFDPALADVFVDLDFGPYHHLIGKHEQHNVEPEEAA